MKKTILNIALATFVITGFISCKEKANETTTTEAKEVAKASGASIDYNINTEASQITWKGTKPLGSHTGTINLASGTLIVTNDLIEAGKFSIDMNSIANTDLEGDEKGYLETHLKGTVEGKEGDFFNVTKYPFALFELTGVSEKEGKTMVSGNLTIKEKTNNIEFPATIAMEDGKIQLKSDAFIIDRTKWGVNYGSKSIFDNLGDQFIDDDMEITISLIANKS